MTFERDEVRRREDEMILGHRYAERTPRLHDILLHVHGYGARPQTWGHSKSCSLWYTCRVEPTERRMNRQKRRVRTKSRRSSAVKRARKIRTAARARRGSTTTRRAAASNRVTSDRTQAVQLFEAQIQNVWNRFGQECLQFAEGFNNEIGANQLVVDCNSDRVVARFSAGGEMLVQLDREHHHVDCYISSSCGDFGSCVVEQPPLGFFIESDRLRWVFGAASISEDDLAVKLMTELVQLDAAPKSAASR